jgi:5'(3')-deoxyribonucleotidase
MSKPIIAIDMDEVLVPHFEGLIHYHNDKYGTKIKFEEIKHHHFEEYWGISWEESLRRGWQYIIDNHEKAEPLLGAVDALRKLQKKYRLIVVTLRSESAVSEVTNHWLDKFFKGVVEEILFMEEDEQHYKLKTKAEICNELGANWLIDDSLTQILATAEAGVKGILFGDYAWNQAEKLPQNVTRVKGWPEVLEYFDAQG